MDHSDKWFQSKSFTIPICPMWFKIILSSQSYSIAKCWQSKVCVLNELDLLIGSSSDPRFLMSHITRESPDDARYLESNGLNLTPWTLELCLQRVSIIGLPNYFVSYAFLTSRIFTRVSSEPVASKLGFKQLQSTVLISDLWTSLSRITGDSPILKSQKITWRSTLTLHIMSLEFGQKLMSSTLCSWPVSLMNFSKTVCLFLSGLASLR